MLESELTPDLASSLRKADLSTLDVAGVVSKATLRTPWILSMNTPPFPFATLTATGEMVGFHCLEDAILSVDTQGVAEVGPITCELIPLGEGGAPIKTEPPIAVRGQLADILIFDVPKSLGLNTEQTVGITRPIRRSLEEAARAGLIKGSFNVVQLPPECRLYRLQEKK